MYELVPESGVTTTLLVFLISVSKRLLPTNSSPSSAPSPRLNGSGSFPDVKSDFLELIHASLGGVFESRRYADGIEMDHAVRCNFNSVRSSVGDRYVKERRVAAFGKCVERGSGKEIDTSAFCRMGGSN